MTIVISDGDGEGIVAVELVSGVGPGACFRIDGGRTVAGVVAGCDGEVSERNRQRTAAESVLVWMSVLPEPKNRQ